MNHETAKQVVGVEEMKAAVFLILALACCVCPGCIEADCHFSFYLQADGRVDGVAFIDNARSTTGTAEARTAEEREWIDSFRKAETGEIKSLRNSGATAIDTKLLRETVPYSAAVRWSYADVEGLGTLFEIKREGGMIDFRTNGAGRTLALHFKGRKTKEAKTAAGAKEGKAPQPPEWTFKFIPVGGRLLKTTGCKADPSKSFCVLDIKELDRLERAGKSYDVMIEWEVLGIEETPGDTGAPPRG